MTNKVEKSTNQTRERVVVFLGFLTSEECLEACRQFIPTEVLAAALVRLWFDEIYVPGDSYLHGLKGDRSAASVAAFRACFSEEELTALERFHGFFELRLDFAANRMKGRAHFPENDSWRSVIRDASYMLADLEADPDRLREMLASMVKEAVRDGGLDKLLETLRGRKRLNAP